MSFPLDARKNYQSFRNSGTGTARFLVGELGGEMHHP
jgi:hypothetical protein